MFFNDELLLMILNVSTLKYLYTYPSGNSTDDCSNRKQNTHEKSQKPVSDEAYDEASYEGREPGKHCAHLVPNANFILGDVSMV